jgi:hypothetical protein
MSIAFVHEKANGVLPLVAPTYCSSWQLKKISIIRSFKSVASPTQLEYVRVNKLDMTFFKWTTPITCANNVLCTYLMIHFRVVECCSLGFERW